MLSYTFSVLSAILPVILAQDSGSGSYLQQLVEHLNNIGHTGAASLLSSANSSDSAQQWLSHLQDGNYTVFVPSNSAFQNLSSAVSNNTDLAVQYLPYHFVHGDFQNSTSNSSTSGGGGGATSSAAETQSSTESFSESSTVTATQTQAARQEWYIRQDERSGNSTQSGGGNSSSIPILSDIYPNVTIGRTLLNSSEFVRLEGGKAQVLAWTRDGPDGNVTILNQVHNITVTNSSTFQNLLLSSVDGFIIPPGNLSTALEATNITAVQNLLQQATITSANGTNITALGALEEASGYTLFVPNDEALQETQQILSQYQNNQTALYAILGNHIVNGTSIYSPDFKNATASGSDVNFVTAAGDTLSVSYNTSGLFVQNQNGSSAQIIRPDVLVENGVFHIIDNILLDTASDPQQASSAYESATSAASAMSSTDTLPIGAGYATLTSSGAQQSSTSGSSSMESSSTQSSSSGGSSTSTDSSTSSTSAPSLNRYQRVHRDSAKANLGSPAW